MAFRNLPVSIEQLNRGAQGNMVGALGIVFTEAGDDWLRATMPVNEKTKQPFGLLHGGASVVLAETLGSMAGWLCVDGDKEAVVGIDINANHVRGVRDGNVVGTVRPLHLGRSTQVWEIRIENEDGKLVCISRLTTAVVPKP